MPPSLQPQSERLRQTHCPAHVLRNITKRKKQLEEQLLHDAFRRSSDRLAKPDILNRLAQAIQRTKRHQGTLWVIVVCRTF